MRIVHPNDKATIKKGDFIRIGDSYYIWVEGADIEGMQGEISLLVNIQNGDVYYRTFAHVNHLVNHLEKHYSGMWEVIKSNRTTLYIDYNH